MRGVVRSDEGMARDCCSCSCSCSRSCADVSSSLCAAAQETTSWTATTVAIVFQSGTCPCLWTARGHISLLGNRSGTKHAAATLASALAFEQLGYPGGQAGQAGARPT